MTPIQEQETSFKGPSKTTTGEDIYPPEIAAARDRIRQRLRELHLNNVIIGATYIAEGVTKFADWVTAMRKEDIDLTDAEMEQMFKESQALYNEEELPAADTPLIQTNISDSDMIIRNAAADAADQVLIGAIYIAKGVTKFADWVPSMRGSGIELTDAEMEQLFKESKAFDAGEELPAAEMPLKTRKAKAPAIDKVKAIAADEEQLDSRTVYELVVEKMKAHAMASPNPAKAEMTDADFNSICKEVTTEVKAYFPDITEREIRDLFSGYGIILKKEELSEQVRQLSAFLEVAKSIVDANAKIAQLKPGPQRDEATQAVQRQRKKLARDYRMSGFDHAAGSPGS